MSEQCPPNSTCHNTNANFADFQPDLFHSRVGRNEQAWTPLNVACTQSPYYFAKFDECHKIYDLSYFMAVTSSTVWYVSIWQYSVIRESRLS